MTGRLRRALARALRDEYAKATVPASGPPPGALRRALTADVAARCAALPREPWMCDDCTMRQALSRPCDEVCRRGWARRWEKVVDPAGEAARR